MGSDMMVVGREGWFVLVCLRESGSSGKGSTSGSSVQSLPNRIRAIKFNLHVIVTLQISEGAGRTRSRVRALSPTSIMNALHGKMYARIVSSKSLSGIELPFSGRSDRIGRSALPYLISPPEIRAPRAHTMIKKPIAWLRDAV